ncbi:AraC family transcriptional regulator ligand-binding domain-containing protein [Candidatus Thiodiazotropha sp. LNASS1]|uniref:AraC family transcriptional regulator n=1 Tax=Candidatus Thiodiazotropha sp. LNASS1 TaxID=3096260 RepID=UPI0034DFF649
MRKFIIDQGWNALFHQHNIDAKEILIRADLPQDLFTRIDASLSTAEYFRLWDALAVVMQNPTLPIHLVESLSTDFFSPPLFAAYCSPNLNVALERLSHYKPLIGPCRLIMTRTRKQTRLEVEFLEKGLVIPTALVASELTFFVQLARMATREHIKPSEVLTPIELKPKQAYNRFFGIIPKRAKKIGLSFRATDAERPFISANEKMWEFFESGLNQRLADLSAEDDFTTRVRSLLLELLPAGQSSIEAVSDRLLISKRTLQRRLNQEETNFQQVLNEVREDLATHYLKNSELTHTQISFLLGFNDPNSFFRAYHGWTGTTPESARNDRLLN